MLNFISVKDFLSKFCMERKNFCKLLEKEGGATIEELLLEEETVSEAKNNNEDLLKLLC